MTKRAISPRKPVNIRMPQDPNPPSAIDQAVSRALREKLERIQRTTDELHQAVSDISAALDVMSRFVSSSVQGSPRSPFEAEMARIANTMTAPEPAPPSAVYQAAPAAPQHREPARPAPAPPQRRAPE